MKKAESMERASDLKRASALGRAVWNYMTARSLFVPLLLIECLMVVVVSPRGNFPLNDDWVYAQMVGSLLNEHRLVVHPFARITAVTPVLWGAAFCSVFGMSYTVLRVATLVLGLLGAWGAALCGRICGLSRGAALLCGVALLVNPLHANLSYTFMAEVPFCTMLTFSSLFYLRGLRTFSARDVALGSLFGVLAFYTRQFGIIPALAYVPAAAIAWVSDRRAVTIKGVMAFAVPWAIGLGVFLLWRGAHDASVLIDTPLVSNPFWTRVFFTGVYACTILSLIGLLLAPVTCARVCGLPQRFDAVFLLQLAVTGVFAGLAAWCFMRVLHYPLPQPGNILWPAGLGPVTLYVDPRIKPWWTPDRLRIWWPLTAFGILSGGILLSSTVSAVLRRKTPSNYPGAAPGQPLFLVLWAALVLASSYTPFTHYPFDRYSLPALVPAAILVAYGFPSVMNRVQRTVSFALCAVLLAFSMAGTQDYLACNAARWEAARYLLQTVRAAPEQIAGGYEFNGIYTSGRYVAEHGVKNFWEYGDDGWWMIDNAFMVTRGPVAGYTILEEFPYFTYLGMKQCSVYALARNDSR